MKKEYETRMTSGSIPVQILKFAIPLMLGNLFQLLYSTVDTIIVGQFVGKTAVAAIGTSTPIVDLIISFFMGLSSGSSVVVSRFFGAKQHDDVKRTIDTFICFGLIFGTILSIAGVCVSRSILVLMNTPSNVLDMASTYLKIYFAGALAQCIYNAGTGILQATGDSRHPLYFLVTSSIVNVILDLLFVVGFHMAVAGVALATIISQVISALLVLRALMNMNSEYALNFKNLKIEKDYLIPILKIGVPTSLQSVIISLSNVIVQTYINAFGESSIAAFSISCRLNEYVGLSGRSISLAVTTFSGQNLGAREFKRVTKGVLWGMALCFLSVVIIGGPMMIKGSFFMSMFTDDKDVINTGVRLIRVMIPGYILFTSHLVMSGALRASGRSLITMIISIFCFTLLRPLFLAIMMPLISDMTTVGLCYTVSWSAAFIMSGSYYLCSGWLKKEAEKAADD